MCSFKQGDIIYKKLKDDFDYSTKFEIIKIECEKTGNWHDGFVYEYICVLKNVETSETHKFHIESDNFMTNYKCLFAIKHV